MKRYNSEELRKNVRARLENNQNHATNISSESDEGEDTNQKDHVMMESSAISSKIRENATRKKSNIRKQRHINYMIKLNQLNNAFADYMENEYNEWQAVKQNALSRNLPVPLPKFYIDEAESYKNHLNRIKQDLETSNRECSIFTFGSGDCGQLGLSTEKLNAKRPNEIKNLSSDVNFVACGGLHNAVVSGDGDVYTWGCNDDGALGLLDENDKDKKKIDETFIPKKVLRLCSNMKDFNQIPANEAIKSVATGDSHTLALSYTGTVYMFGAYKDKEGKYWRDVGPIGYPKSNWETTEKQSDAPSGIQESPIPVSKLKDLFVESIACGSSANAAILNDQTLVTWGIGECGELGRPAAPMKLKDGSYDKETIKSQYLTPAPPIWNCGGSFLVHSVACGSFHTLVITSNFRVATSGLNNYGQLGHGDIKNRDRLTFVQSLDSLQVKEVAGGNHHSLCLANNGRVIAFGRGDSGQLGNTDNRPQVGYCEEEPVTIFLPNDNKNDIQPKDPVSKISCGANHNLAITKNGDLYTWGYGDMNALGHGDDKDEYRPKKLVIKRPWKVYQAVGGGQHSAILCAKDINE